MPEVTRALPVENSGRLGGNRDIGFAIGIVAILIVLFLPIPAFLLDMGLALSITLSVLILMVALWIPRPLDFSAFPTVLLIATMLRLSTLQPYAAGPNKPRRWWSSGCCILSAPELFNSMSFANTTSSSLAASSYQCAP